MTGPLDELLEAGKAKREANAREVTAAATREDFDARRATSALGVMAAREWAWVSYAVIGVSLTMLLVPEHQHRGHTADHANENLYVVGGGVAIGLAMIGAMLAARAAVRRSYARELAWVASLPFRLEGHLRMLPSSAGTFRIDFEDTVPERRMLEQLVLGIDCASVELDSHSGSTFRIEVRNGRDTSSRTAWRGWRGVVDRFLIPLHARYRITAVTFT